MRYSTGLGHMKTESKTGRVKEKPYSDGVLPIAIVGMACRLPGDVHTLDDFWKMCAQARSGWCDTPSDRFSNKGFYHPNPQRPGTMNYKGAHYLKDDIAQFDAPFFSITAKQAEAMDPQQRLMMECTYEALENGGITLTSVAGENVGVFMAGSYSDYLLHLLKDLESTPMHAMTGCDASMMANRISYAFNFKGPSMTIDTACSSGLTALHMACQSIRAGEVSVAVVGGCHLNIMPDISVAMSMIGLLSPDGKSYSFDQRGDSGFGRGEGVSCIIIKRLDDAMESCDPIRSVIRNTGVNQDGRTAGISMPSGEAQESLIRSTYRIAGLDPLDTQYVEAHGTGTAAGDPIEANALGAVFGRTEQPQNPIYVGSVKSNIGHLEGGSGIVSVIKAAMMLERGMILPNCDFEVPKESIPFTKWNMKIPDSMLYWPRKGIRRASVNNFGIGGSNGHVILEEPPRDMYEQKNGLIPFHGDMAELKAKTQIDRRRLYIVTGNDDLSAKMNMKKIAVYLQQRTEALFGTLLADIAYTLGERRTLHSWKFVTHAESISGLVKKLNDPLAEPVRTTRVPRLGFVFSGQGAQWCGMGRQLLTSYPVFQRSMQGSEKILANLGAEWSLIEILTRDENLPELNQTHLSQPICTAIQIALVDLFKSWSILPTAVVGHSSGEIAAAYAAGALTVEDCLAVAFFRGISVTRMKSTHPDLKGSMMAVGVSEKEIRPFLNALKSGDAVVACINSPVSCTVSGDSAAIIELQGMLDERGTFYRMLAVEVAYHSHHMAYAADDYRSLIEQVLPLEQSDVPFYSSLTGHFEKPACLTASYWVDNLLHPVQFAQALHEMIVDQRVKSPGNTAVDILIEIGPHSVLKGPVEQSLRYSQQFQDLTYIPSLVRSRDAVETVLEMASFILMKGYRPNTKAINAFNSENKAPVVIKSLPPYSWRHTERYWAESRISSHHRLKTTLNDILGSRTADSSDLQPVWRNVVRLDDLPWLRDHKVQSLVVYPMCGYISMAIEAINEYAELHKSTVESFALREVSISQALILSEDSEVDMFISLRPFSQGTRHDSDVWKEFTILSWTKFDDWREHCRGLISIVAPLVPFISDFFVLTDNNTSGSTGDSNGTGTTNFPVQPLDPSTVYNSIESSGICFGPIFRGLRDIQTGCDFASAKMKIPDVAATMPKQYERQPIIHPVTLDICFHVIWPVRMSQGRNLDQIYLPTFLESLTIKSNIDRTPGKCLDLLGTCCPSSSLSGELVSTFIARDPIEPEEQPLIVARGLKSNPVPHTQRSKEKVVFNEICFKEEWKMQIDSIPAIRYQGLFSVSPSLGQPSVAEQCSRIYRAEQAALYYIEKALEEVDMDESTIQASLHAKLYEWMKQQHCLLQEGSLHMQDVILSRENDHERIKHLDDVRLSGPDGEALTRIGESLPDILREKVDPLELLMENDLLGRFYANYLSFMHRMYPAALRIMDILTHKNPGMDILEIGAGTGSLTLPLLEAMGGAGGKPSRFHQYHFTDIGPSFLEAAKVKFAEWESRVTYRKLNIEEDPVPQGFVAKSYDLIIAAAVLHATSDIANTMRNVHKLLKPNGKLLIIELTAPNLRSFPFATLPGWWLGSESFRQNGPSMSLDSWRTVFEETGFSGIDGWVDDYPGDLAQESSMIISTALATDTPHNLRYPEDVCIICSHQNHNVSLKRLINGLSDLTGHPPTVKSLEEIHGDTSDKTFIFLDDLEKPTLVDIDSENFARIQRLCLAAGLLWVTEGGTQESPNPNSAIAIGMIRSVRRENDNLNLVTLDLDAKRTLSADSSADMILTVIRRSFVRKQEVISIENEYSELGGILHVLRFVPDLDMNQFILGEIVPDTPTPQEYPQEGRPLRLAMSQVGLLDTLHFTDDPEPVYPLPDDQIQIQVHAVGLAFRDVLTALGEVTSPDIGSELSGVVTAIGSTVTDFEIGDAVWAASTKAYSTFVRVPASSAAKIGKLSFIEGASLPLSYLTAYHSLVDVGRLQRGESVLIHAAAGGVGQAAIAVAQMVGAEIYATVGTDEKRSHLTENYGIPSDHIFYSRDTSFGGDIMRATSGKGIDVALNCLAGDALRVTWECIAKFGRLVEIGKRDVYNNSRLEMSAFRNNATFSYMDLGLLTTDRPDQMRRLVDTVMDLLDGRQLKRLTPITAYPVSEIETAFRTLAAGTTIGKTAIDLSNKSVVKITPPKTKTQLFRADCSYLLTGGGGGLGRSTALWMARRGARYIIIASRNGLKTEKTRELARTLEAEGVTVYVCCCDVGVKEQVSEMIANAYQRQMPSICGVIHGAMVLKDTVFEQMNFEDYTAVLKPKIKGAWNLHECLLTANLDFFVMLGSGAGIIGNRGQAAYAGTSTFLGSFTHFRRSLGLAAQCIDLGPVRGIGYLAERPELRDDIESNFGIVLNEYLFFALLTAAVSGDQLKCCNYESVACLSYQTEIRPSFYEDRKFSHCVDHADAAAGGEGKTAERVENIVSLRKTFANARSAEEFHPILGDALTDRLCRILSIDRQNLDLSKPLSLYGMDSLSAVELRNWISHELNIKLALVDVTRRSLSEIVEQIMGLSSFHTVPK